MRFRVIQTMRNGRRLKQPVQWGLCEVCNYDNDHAWIRPYKDRAPFQYFQTRAIIMWEMDLIKLTGIPVGTKDSRAPSALCEFMLYHHNADPVAEKNKQ